MGSMTIEELANARLNELGSIGIVGVISEDGDKIELKNLSSVNKKYIQDNIRYGFIEEEGKLFVKTQFPDKPLGQTCEGLSFQAGENPEKLKNEQARNHYSKLQRVYDSISIERREKIQSIFKSVMKEFGYQDSDQIKRDMEAEDFGFSKRLYEKFGAMSVVPQQVKEYDNPNDVVIYSGARDVQDKISRLKNGEYPFTSQSTFGFGYYFSDDLYTPRVYAKRDEKNIMEVRLDASARVIDKKDLDALIPTLLDGVEETAETKTIRELLKLPEFSTLACLCSGHDCMAVDSNYKVGEKYYIPVNLSCLKISGQPLYMKTGSQSEGTQE